MVTVLAWVAPWRFPDDAFDQVFPAPQPQADGEQDLRLELVFELLAHELDPKLLVEVFRLLEGLRPTPTTSAC